ncbi:hypothetical protein RMSM_02548 [Rhodopirellula maiorica SM1]|uniref:Uncharacterized protein n=1 Tax=Rhodopirellula maiorica SM1 TaxID=1265738 RepID=M5RMT8_9BACT|nr:hypothetical protein [Rhodopirellula maiorica]EMI20516.1 hypothetical protein RMSM_02548 [Rhodopirellula maiorica SM1]
MPHRINPYTAPIRTAPPPTKPTYGRWLIACLIGWFATVLVMSTIIDELAEMNDRQQRIIWDLCDELNATKVLKDCHPI